MSEGTNPLPRFSVVVGSSDAAASVRDCLQSLTHQAGADGGATEIIVVEKDATAAERIRAHFPAVRVLVAPDAAYIPQLWGRGITETQGEIVLLTTAHCVPAEDWLIQTRRAWADLPLELAQSLDRNRLVGMGGAIAQDERGGLVDWAVYFCRYWAFAPPFAVSLRPEIAGDNASYRREALTATANAWADGFWEPEVHAALRTAGGSLAVTPRIVVRHRHSYGFWSFVRQRYEHGRQYGGARASRELTGAGRAAMILAGPLLPFLLLGRATRAAFSRPQLTGRFCALLPILFAFYCAWSLGEWTGYVAPRWVIDGAAQTGNAPQ